MMPKDGRCEEHGMYLYRTGFGWSCKLGCYYCDDPQKIKEGYIQQYKEELKNKINKLIKKLEKSLVKLTNTDRAYQQGKIEQLRELLKLLESDKK